MTLSVNNLCVTLNRREILHNLSFTIEKGSITGLLGANGSGKTTTFLTLIGLHPKTSGTIEFDGHMLCSLPMYKRARLGIGYLPQESSLFKELTVEENILVFLEGKKLTKKEKKEIVREKLEELNVYHLAKAKASYLSGGEKRRVEIARTLTTNPKILFLDEPFANIDPKSIEDVKNLIQFLKEKNISIFITDHNANALLPFIDKGILLHKGKVLSIGDTKELIEDPLVKEHYLGSNFAFV